MNTLNPIFAAALCLATAACRTEAEVSTEPSPERTEGAEPRFSERDLQLVSLARDSTVVETGKQTYAAYCLACHGPEGLNVDAPSNLFDGKWLNGAHPSRIEESIRQGFLEKGMPAWGEMISDPEIESVIAYLLTFQKPDQNHTNE